MCNSPDWGPKFYFSHFLCHSPPACVNPQMKLMKVLRLCRSDKIFVRINLGRKESVVIKQGIKGVSGELADMMAENLMLNVGLIVTYNHRLKLYCVVLSLHTRLKKQPCMRIALKKTKQSIVCPIFAAQLIRGLLGWMMWKCHTINLFSRHKHLPSSLPICFAWELAPHSIAFSLHCYYNSLYASPALIKLWFLFIHLLWNIPVNKLVSEMFRFVVLHE